MAESLLKLDIEDLLDAAISNKDVSSVSVVIHTTDDDITPTFFDTFVVTRDYIRNVTDYIVVEMDLGLGDIYYDVYPNRGNLEVSLTFQNRDKEGEEYSYTERYKAVLINLSHNMDNPLYAKSSQEELNQTVVGKLCVQCYLREYEAIRNLPSVCNASMATVQKAMELVLSRSTIGKDIKIDGNALDYNLDIREPDNKEVYTKIQVETQGTIPTLLNFPSYLQAQKGVYNGHIGTYIQRYTQKNDGSKTLFVYPLIDTELFDSSDNNCIIYLPVDLMISKFADKTYYQDGDTLKILAADINRSKDTAKYEVLDKGSGIAYSHPREILSRGMVQLDEKGNANYDRNKSVQQQDLGTLEDGTSNILYKGMSTNNFISRSYILENDLIYMDLRWNCSNPDLIYPGMPVNVYKEELNKEITVYTGNIVKTFTLYTQISKTFTSSLSLSLKKKEKK